MFGRSKAPKALSPREYARQLRDQAYSGVRKTPTPYIGETLGKGDEEERAYEKSKFFQVYLNQLLRGSGFCFDEQESTTCVIDTFDQPDYGRSYLVSYYSLDIGTIEIRLGYDLWEDKDDGELLSLFFDLTKLEFLDYRHAVGLLQQLALAVMPLDDANKDQAEARRLANDYMLEALWENRHDEAVDTWSKDERPHVRATGQFTGPAGHYLHALEHWRKSRDDLLAEPNRDGLPARNKQI